MNAVECLTGLTVKQDTDRSWKVVKMGKEGINQRFGNLDGILIFLNPETRDLQFNKIKESIQRKINDFQTESDISDTVTKSVLKDKINYLQSMIVLFETFAKVPAVKNARENFKKNVEQFTQSKRLIALMAEQLYISSINADKLTSFMKEWDENNKRECYSNCMTTSESLEFWSKRSNFEQGESPEERKIYTSVQDGVIRFMHYQLNSSNIERIFKKMHKSAPSSRNRLHVDTLSTETLVLTLRQQHDIFQTLKVPVKKRIGYLICHKIQIR